MIRGTAALTYEGLEMEYSIHGEGEPILVFHGGHSNCNEQFGYATLENEGYSLITPSRPGYGTTSEKIGKSLAQSCRYYMELLNQLRIQKVHVIAMSAGGPTGMMFASLYPERVRTLTLQSAVTMEWLKPKDKKYKLVQFMFHPLTEKWVWRLMAWLNNKYPSFIFEKMAPSFSTLPLRDIRKKQLARDLYEVRYMNNRQRSGKGFFLDLKQSIEVTKEHLKQITCPTIILHSKYDASVPLTHPQHAHTCIRRSELHLLHTWGHLIWLGAGSEEMETILLDFLKRHSL